MQSTKFIDILFDRLRCRSKDRHRGSASDHFGTRPDLERRTSITVDSKLLINRRLIATESDRGLTRSRKKSLLIDDHVKPCLTDFRLAVKKSCFSLLAVVKLIANDLSD